MPPEDLPAADSPLPADEEAPPDEKPALPFVPPPGSWRASLTWVVLLTLAYFALALPLLARVPRVIMDESWEACTGWSLAFEGRLRNPVIRNRDGIDRAFVQPRVVQSLVLAPTYRLLGFSLSSGRVASILIGWLTVLGTYWLMRTWLSPPAAGLIGLLLACETQFFMLARVVRPEIYVTATAIWMLALLARGTTRPSRWLCLTAGLVGGVGCYTHPNMLIFAALGLGLIVYQCGFRPRTVASTLCYAAGGLLATVPFIIWVVYAQRAHDVRFFAQLGDWYTSSYDAPVGSVVRSQIARWVTYLQVSHRAPWVALLALSGIVALVRRHPIQVWGLVLIIGCSVLLPLLNRSASPRYLLMLAPWFAALVGLFALQVGHWATTCRARLPRYGLRAVALGSLIGTFAVQLAGDGYVLYKHRDADYDAVCARIASNVPAGARLYAPLVFWTGLRQYPYLSDINDVILGDELDLAGLFRSWYAEFKPQYFVRATDLCWTVGGLGPRDTKLNYVPYGASAAWIVAKDEVEQQFVERRGVLLERFTTYDFGTIEIYRLR